MRATSPPAPLPHCSTPEPADRPWQLTGPAPVTLPAVAARLGLRRVAVPPRLAARALARGGADAYAVDHALRMAACFATGCDAHPTDHVLRLTAASPRSIGAYLDEQHDAFAPATPLARALRHPVTKEPC